MSTQWQDRYSECARRMTSSAIREILKFAQRPDIISLAGGWPDPALFPVEDLDEICHYILAEKGREALQYGITEGYPPLRRFLAERMAAYGLVTSEENIVITAGSQQALDLLGRIFLDPGDAILLEKPSYVGAIQAWRTYGVKFVTVPLDDEGMRVDLLEEALVENRPKFIYALPNFQNPAGVTLSLERRGRLVELADR
ncbi:MAG TPA: PLP-dependent aminotransferase family protein, partial [Anaerolineae bacterium]|nr:PLP-dependent aminotransferase family protein [Anaerolineae bacterium]